MADNIRKIYFQIEDQNVESTFNRYKQVMNESARSMIANANQASKSGREVIKYLEEEIKLRERGAKIEFAEQRSDVKDIYQRKMSVAKTGFEREKLVKEYKGELQGITASERKVDTQTTLLREIIEALKQTSREEIREDRKNVEKQVARFEKGELKGLTNEEESKLKIQSEMLGKERRKTEQKRESVFGDVFSATFLAQQLGRVSGIIGARSSEEAATKMIAPMGTAAGFLGGLAFASPKTGAVIGGALGEIAQVAIERHLQARNRLEQTQLYYSGVTGRKTGLGGAIQYGKTSADIAQDASELARSRKILGTGSEMYEKTLDYVSLQKAYSLDKSQLLGLSKTERFGGGGAMRDTGLMVEALRSQGMWDKNSQTKIPEYLEMLVSLQEEQIKVTGSVDNSRNLSNLMAMSKLGDKYFRDTTYVTGISNALSRPQNEFQEARSLSVLAKTNPGASYFQLKLMQEKGLGQEGYMTGVLDNLRKRYGEGKYGTEMRAMALKETLKAGGKEFSLQDALNIIKKQDEERGMFDTVFDDESFDKAIKGFKTTTRRLGAERTSGIEKKYARSEEAFSKGAIEGASTMVKDTWLDIKNISHEIYLEFKNMLDEQKNNKKESDVTGGPVMPKLEFLYKNEYNKGE